MKKYVLLVILAFIPFWVYSQNSNVTAVKYFFAHPFQSNIIMPDFPHEYRSYDELYSKIGTPLNITKLNASQIGENTYFLEYENYSLCIVYSEYKDVIYIAFIWITLKENIQYTYDIRMGDNLEKIEGIFGKADYVADLRNGILEYHYYFGNLEFGQLNIQLENNRLKSIILWYWD